MDADSISSDLNKLKLGLGKIPEPSIKPVFVLVSGLPGTGKSYFSRKLAARLPCVVLESDALRKRLCSSPDYSASESNRLFRACHCLIEDLLHGGHSVILDATNLVEYNRERLYKIAERLQVKLIIVQVEAPQELVRERLQSRFDRIDPEDNSDADWHVYERMKTAAQRIRHNYFALDTSRDISPVIDKIVREAKR
jgi:predicted kinase